MLLQIFNDITAGDALGLTGLGAAVGGVVPIIVQKIFSKKADDIDVLKKEMELINTQVKSLQENQIYTDNVIKELQEVACYKKCEDRLNGKKKLQSKPKSA